LERPEVREFQRPERERLGHNPRSIRRHRPRMRPVAVINGIMFGSAVAIGLAVTLLVVAVLAPESPRLRGELRPLLATTALFLVVSGATGAAFFGQLLGRRWRWPAQCAALASVAGAVVYFLPDP
jgi:hypothetical protein